MYETFLFYLDREFFSGSKTNRRRTHLHSAGTKKEEYHAKDEKIGIIFPIYWLLVPPLVEEFLRKARLESDYIFAVLTYGSLNGNAVGHLQKIGKECGITFSYVKTLKMVDNYLPGFDMDKQLQTASKKQIEEHMNTIVREVQLGKQEIQPAFFFGHFLTPIMRMSGKNQMGTGVSKQFQIEDTCVGCGICVKACPVHNIVMEQSQPKFGSKCLSCLACTQNCPPNSIRMTNEKSRSRFRNASVSLQEIIEANE